jgi:hypothetical protein
VFHAVREGFSSGGWRNFSLSKGAGMTDCPTHFSLDPERRLWRVGGDAVYQIVDDYTLDALGP